MMTKTALITGAGRRLGLHMTESLLAHGWRVIALTRQVNGELQRICDSKLKLHCIEVDALDDASIDSAVSEIKAYCKSESCQLDFILHNASIYEKDGDHAADFMTFYDALYQIHMKMPARLNTELASLLQGSVQNPANVIHITDIYVDNPNPAYALYCSTKAGSENLMKSFAKRLAPTVRVNAIQPGPIKFLPEHSSDDQTQVLSETLLPIEGGFEALEKAIYSLLENDYMTGAVIKVDGGRSLK